MTDTGGWLTDLSGSARVAVGVLDDELSAPTHSGGACGTKGAPR